MYNKDMLNQIIAAQNQKKKANIIFPIISMALWILGITLILIWFDWRLFVVFFVMLAANNFQNHD